MEGATRSSQPGSFDLAHAGQKNAGCCLMNASGSDVGSPFMEGLDADRAVHDRPWVDDEVMRRLRTPFEADPVDVLDQQRVAGLSEDDHRDLPTGRVPRSLPDRP